MLLFRDNYAHACEQLTLTVLEVVVIVPLSVQLSCVHSCHSRDVKHVCCALQDILQAAQQQVLPCVHLRLRYGCFACKLLSSTRMVYLSACQSVNKLFDCMLVVTSLLASSMPETATA